MIGDSFIWTGVDNIYAKFQKWFSGYDMSHISLGTGYMVGIEWEYGADVVICAKPYKAQENILVFPCPYPKEVIEEAIRVTAKKTAGKLYAFLQILYFLRRLVYEKIPFLWKVRNFISKILTGNTCISPKKLSNWFPRSHNCTELWYDIVRYAAEKVKDEKMISVMNEFHGNNLYVSDCYEMIIRGWR